MSIFNVEATQIAHIPIVKSLVNVRHVLSLLSPLGGCHLCAPINEGYLRASACQWKHCAGHCRDATRHAHVVSKRRMSLASASTSAAPATATSSKRTLLKRLLHRDCQLLNGGDLKHVLCPASVLSGRGCETHCSHLQHDSRLVSRELTYHCRDLCIDSTTWGRS